MPTNFCAASFSSARLAGIYEDGAGTLWVGADATLNRLDRATGLVTAYAPPDAVAPAGRPEANTIFSIIADKQGMLWFDGLDGLYRFNPQTKDFKRYLPPNLRAGENFERWVVGGHSIDIHDGRGNGFARSGKQSVDLSGEAPGSIYQTMATQPGQKYRVTFWYAGHPYHPYEGDAMATVSWGYRGATERQFVRVSRPASPNDQQLNWMAGQLDVVAEFHESFLTFTSNSPNGGIILDDVQIQPID